MVHGMNIYSLQNVSDIPAMTIELDGTKYEINIKWVQKIDCTEQDMLIFFKVFLNKMMQAAGFKLIGI